MTRGRKNFQVLFGATMMICVLANLWLSQDTAQANLLKADKVVVVKSERSLMLMKNGAVLKKYRVALGKNPTGRKTREGDQKTPEGLYYLDWRNPNSQYHLALHISYPNPEDVRNASALGVSAGDNVMIHGLPNEYQDPGKLQRRDWTHGCIAVTNTDIEEIWTLVPDGIPIEIKP
ncbi:MAG: L,D-transpeptidase catalytic domain [Syntrophus sp. PtaU1.Bin208]|nr:MAG: L,D-transpeptidase catalytic domain [Syntrophus sp. PtaU1.Bin208]